MTIARTDPAAGALLDHCRRYADAHVGPDGAAGVSLPGLSVVRAMRPGALQVAVQKPVIAMLLQGRKRVTTAGSSFEYAPGEAMIIAADIPTVSQVTQASPAAPYYSLVLDLSPAILKELSGLKELQGANAETGIHRAGRAAAGPVRIEPMAPEVTDAALRLARLFDRPETLAVLGEGLLRELHYWLLKGGHGPAIRAIGTVNSMAERIGRAVEILRRDYARQIRVSELADVAGMSEAAFHRQFRAITTLSPLQFQKQLRLIEARRLLLTRGDRIAQAAHAVGYASVPQFTREYGRFFAISPGQDRRHPPEESSLRGGAA